MGLDGCGKSTLMHKLGLERTVVNNTTGDQASSSVFVAPSYKINDTDVFTLIQVGGSDRPSRAVLSARAELYADAKALIWVIDAADLDRLRESLYELREALEGIMAKARQVPVMLLMNKKDMPKTCSALQLQEHCSGRTFLSQDAAPSIYDDETTLRLDSALTHAFPLKPLWRCFDVEIISCKGVSEAIDWLGMTLRGPSTCALI